MTLQLKRPLVFFDLETTGTNIAKDRIVEIALLKVFPDGNREGKTLLVNPEIPIPPEATEIHGIDNEKVANHPNFKTLAPQIESFIKGCDLVGFNSNRFDIPLLAEELLRAGRDFDMKGHFAVDVQTIFHKKEQRTLSAGYQFYCGKTLENAHSAMADTEATCAILFEQVQRYNDIGRDIKQLSEFSSYRKNVDLAGMISLNEKEEPVFNFGKYKGQSVAKVFKKDQGYYSWIQQADFPLYTKKVLTAIKLNNFNKV